MELTAGGGIASIALIASIAAIGCRPEPAPVSNASVAPARFEPAPATSRADEAPPDDPLAPVYAYALQGNLETALTALDTVDPVMLDEAQHDERACLIARFRDGRRPRPTTDDPFVEEVIGIYHEYWSKMMLGEVDRVQGEAILRDGLHALLQKHGLAASGRELDHALESVGAALEAHGYQSIRGVTQPYFDLMAWRVQTPTMYEVVLPESTVNVKVVFLEDFADLGWTSFATCGKFFSGGWATKEALYAVRSAYDEGSESFEVSYLAHEGQHFADYSTFPALEQVELEYRAKLTELVEAESTAADLMVRFATMTGTERTVPHNMANGLVAQHMGLVVFNDESIAPQRWREVDVHDMNAAALQLLQENTAALRAAGATTVTRLFE